MTIIPICDGDRTMRQPTTSIAYVIDTRGATNYKGLAAISDIKNLRGSTRKRFPKRICKLGGVSRKAPLGVFSH